MVYSLLRLCFALYFASSEDGASSVGAGGASSTPPTTCPSMPAASLTSPSTPPTTCPSMPAASMTSPSGTPSTTIGTLVAAGAASCVVPSSTPVLAPASTPPAPWPYVRSLLPPSVPPPFAPPTPGGGVFSGVARLDLYSETTNSLPAAPPAKDGAPASQELDAALDSSPSTIAARSLIVPPTMLSI